MASGDGNVLRDILAALDDEAEADATFPYCVQRLQDIEASVLHLQSILAVEAASVPQQLHRGMRELLELAGWVEALFRAGRRVGPIAMCDHCGRRLRVSKRARQHETFEAFCFNCRIAAIVTATGTVLRYEEIENVVPFGVRIIGRDEIRSVTELTDLPARDGAPQGEPEE